MFAKGENANESLPVYFRYIDRRSLVPKFRCHFSSIMLPCSLDSAVIE